MEKKNLKYWGSSLSKYQTVIKYWNIHWGRFPSHQLLMISSLWRAVKEETRSRAHQTPALYHRYVMTFYWCTQSSDVDGNIRLFTKSLYHIVAVSISNLFCLWFNDYVGSHEWEVSYLQNITLTKQKVFKREAFQIRYWHWKWWDDGTFVQI